MGGLVETGQDDGVAVIRLAVPERRNALGAAVVAALGEALDEAVRDDLIGAVVLTGSDPAFCAGADRSELNPSSFPVLDAEGETLLDVVAAFPKPTIAAVNGMAVGGGASLALACDQRVASTAAWLQFNFVLLGLVPEGGSTHRLSRLVGWSTALDLLMSGRRVTAEEAKDLGLVDDVVTPDALLSVAHQRAARYVAADPVAVSATKRLVLDGLDRPLAEHRVEERRQFIQALERMHPNKEEPAR